MNVSGEGPVQQQVTQALGPHSASEAVCELLVLMPSALPPVTFRPAFWVGHVMTKALN